MDQPKMTAVDRSVTGTELETSLSELRTKMLGMLRKRGVDAELAEDLAQEGLARAWTRLHQIRNPTRLEAWARSIVLNRLRTYFRKADQVEPLTEDLERGLLRESTTAEVDEARELVSKLLRVLGPEQRASIVMRHQDGMSVDAISAVMGLSGDEIRICLHAAMMRLRRHGQRIAETASVRALGIAR